MKPLITMVCQRYSILIKDHNSHRMRLRMCLNVFIKRLWRSVKYEVIYLHAHDPLTQAREGLKGYFLFYNSKRKHQTLKAKPDDVYYAALALLNELA